MNNNYTYKSRTFCLFIFCESLESFKNKKKKGELKLTLVSREFTKVFTFQFYILQIKCHKFLFNKNNNLQKKEIELFLINALMFDN